MSLTFNCYDHIFLEIVLFGRQILLKCIMKFSIFVIIGMLKII